VDIKKSSKRVRTIPPPSLKTFYTKNGNVEQVHRHEKILQAGRHAGRQGRAGQGRAGQGRAGQGRAGQGRAGGRAGQGREGQALSCICTIT